MFDAHMITYELQAIVKSKFCLLSIHNMNMLLKELMLYKSIYTSLQKLFAAKEKKK